MSCAHHRDDLALTSAAITEKDGIIKICYCFGSGNDKLQTTSPFYYYMSFLRIMLDLRKASLKFEWEVSLCSDLHKANHTVQF